MDLPLTDRYAILSTDTDHPQDRKVMGVWQGKVVHLPGMQDAADWALALPEGVTLIVDMGRYTEDFMRWLWQARRARGGQQSTDRLAAMTMGRVRVAPERDLSQIIPRDLLR